MIIAQIMEWIYKNRLLLVGVILVTLILFIMAVSFFSASKEKQQQKIKEWLIWACIEAEKLLQSGTGQLKLREVWNQFLEVPAFGLIAKLITFEHFEELVTDTLMIVKLMLISNSSLAVYVYGENSKIEIEKLKKQLINSEVNENE